MRFHEPRHASAMRRIHWLRIYAVAVLAVVAAVLVALLLRRGLQPDLAGQVASPLLLLAVAVSAWYGGNGPGYLTAGLSLFSLEYLFLPPIYDLGIDWSDAPRFVVFLGASILVSSLTAKRRQAEGALRRTEAKLHAARLIQEQLLPSGPPQVRGVEVAGASFPANTVGGDYFDWVPLRDGSLGVVVADVSGHGLGPALVMAETRAYLRALALTRDDIGEIMTLMNRLLADDTEDGFVTMFFASIDFRRRRLTYAGAGHEGYVLENSGKVRRLCSTSPPLGFEKGVQVPCGTSLTLSAGEILLVCTDGVCETRSPDGALFGVERALEVLRAHRAQSAREIADALYRELQRFAGECPQEDDVTLVVLKSHLTADHDGREE